MVRSIDSDALYFSVVSAFDETAGEDYDLSYTPLTKWTAAPWRFQNGRPLGGFLRLVEPRLIKREPTLTGFRIPKSRDALSDLVKQTQNQTALYVYGFAAAYLAREEDVKLV